MVVMSMLMGLFFGCNSNQGTVHVCSKEEKRELKYLLIKIFEFFEYIEHYYIGLCLLLVVLGLYLTNKLKT
jgi:hypothetical protein